MQTLSDRQIAMGRRQLAIEEELIAGGMPPRMAERQAAEMVLEEDRKAARATLPRDARGHVKLTPEEAEFDANMAAAMGQVTAGNGADVDNLAAAATPIDMDREFGATSTPKPVTQRVPGPVDSTGYSEPGEAIYDEEEARGYATRTPAASVTEEQLQAEKESGGPYRGGAELPSERDRDMYARGMVPTVDPRTGQVGYSVAYVPGGGHSGTPGRLGPRPDLEVPVVDSRTNQPIQGTTKYAPQAVASPLGGVDVYRPTDAFRQQLKAREDRMRIQRLAQRAGMTPDQQVALTTQEGPVNLDALRTRGDALRGADKAARNEARIRRAQALQNPLEYLNRDDISDWNRMVAADAMLRGGYRGATPLDVDARRNEELSNLGLRVAQGQGFQQLTPEQRQMLELKAGELERGLPAEERAPQFRDAPTIHPSEAQMVDDYVKERFSAPGTFGLSSSFTVAEQQQALDWLINEKGYKPEKAQRLVDNIAEKRNAQSMFGNWSGE